MSESGTVMEPFEIILLAIWVIFAAFILFGIFTKRGRRKFIEFEYAAAVTKDLGEVSEGGVVAGKQITKLLECTKDGHKFYVLEVKRSNLLALQYTYIKIDRSLASKIAALSFD